MKPLDFSPSAAPFSSSLHRRASLCRRAIGLALLLPALAGWSLTDLALAQKASSPKGGPAKSAANPSPAASATEAAATPAIPAASSPAAPVAAATPPTDPEGQRLLQEGREVMITAYYPKVEAYQKAQEAFDSAGSISATTFKTKEDIAARRQMLNALIAINDDQINFLKNEPDVLKVELGKVGMAPAKIDQYLAVFSPDPKMELTLEARAHAKESFAAMSDGLNFLEESWGRWSTKNGGHISFKKPADVKKYASIVSAIQKAQSAQNAAIRKIQAVSAPAGAGGSPAPGTAATPPATTTSPAPAATPGK